MASASRSSELARAVRRLMARPAAKARPPVPVIRPVARSAIVGGVALLGLSPAAVNAVGLGEPSMLSALGEPLRATVPMRLGPGEVVRPGCVSTPVRKNTDLRAPKEAKVRMPQAAGPAVVDLQVSTRLPLFEPLYELTLQVDCPGLPRVMRHYVLMLDLPGLAMPAPSSVTEPQLGAPAASARPGVTPAPAPRRRTALSQSQEPIPAGRVYRVREGDTLSTIAARVAGRLPNTTWQLADRIFAANPNAFINGNPDLIKLGYEIRIPDPAGGTPDTPAPSVARADATPALPPAAEPQARLTAPASAPPLTTQEVESAPAATTVTDTVSAPAANAAVDTSLEVPAKAPVMPPAPELTKTAPPPVATSPFADEVEAPAAVAESPTPVVPAPREAVRVSPLLAVLLGLLLGLGLSILLLRSRLLEGLSNLFARGRAEPAERADANRYDDTDEWLKTEHGLRAEALAVGAPAEQTYIVEVDEEEASGDLAAPAVESTPDFETPFAPPDDEYEPELTRAETLDAAAVTGETEEMPGIADTQETAEMPRAAQTQETAEMPFAAAMVEDESATLDRDMEDLLAAEAAAEATEVAAPSFGPTPEPELAELFADDLAELPAEPDLPVEVFAGMDEANDDPLVPTTEMTQLDEPAELLDDDTMGIEPTGLEGLLDDGAVGDTIDMPGIRPDADALEEEEMSETLQQAMSMLEEDFGEDLTASRIIDQGSLKRRLEEDALEDNLDNSELTGTQRKRTG